MNPRITILLTVLPLLALPLAAAPATAQDDHDHGQEAEADAHEDLVVLDAATRAEFGIETTSVLMRGDAATEIIEYANQNQIDLIVAGSRGLSQMRRLLLGSLSRKLVHYAGCSVLIVKGDSHGLE